MNHQRLMRTWYKTDGVRGEYIGAFSNPFPVEKDGRRIVAVDWSETGEVEVTWLIPAEGGV